MVDSQVPSLNIQSSKPLWARVLLSEYLVFYLAVLYFLAVSPFAGRAFVSKANLLDIVSNSIPLLMAAIGQMIVLITAGIDLSIISTIGLASVLGASIMTADGGLLADSAAAVPVALAVILMTGLLAGLLNGGAIAFLRMPPFLVTLASMIFLQGCAVWFVQIFYTVFATDYTPAASFYGLPQAFLELGQGGRYRIWMYIVTIPFPILIAASVAIIAHVVLSHTLTGRRLYAIGHNPKASLISGVPVRRVILFAYAASGFCAAVAAILYTGRSESADPKLLKETVLLDVIGAAVIGGTSLFGGKGKVVWTVFGVLFIALINNSLQHMNMSHFTIMIIKGLVILAAAMVDVLRNRLFAS